MSISDTIRKATCRVDSKSEQLGSSFWVDENMLLTAAHVTEAAHQNSIVVRTIEGELLDAQVVHQDVNTDSNSGSDIALLETNEMPNLYETAVLKGTLTEDASLADEPVDATCPYCGAGVLITYRGDMLFFRCDSCEGSHRIPGFPDGVLTGFPIPPVVLLDRTPDEVFRDATTWSEYQHRLMMNGICPECAGTVTTTTEICPDHDTESGRVCATCQSVHPIRFLHVCSICQLSSRLTPWLHIFTDPAVEAFYAEHGFDSFGPDYFRIWPDTIEGQVIVDEDPLEVQITVAIDEDRRVVTLDETGSVVDVV